jgi:hypothetical protein
MKFPPEFVDEIGPGCASLSRRDPALWTLWR